MSSLTAPERVYPIEVRERALAALALHSNNAEGARRLLEENGVDPIPSARQIRRWRVMDAERYQEIRTQVVDRIRQAQAVGHVRLGYMAMDGERKALDLLLPKLPDMDGRDLSNAHRNLGVVAGIHAQRSGELRGDASIVEHRSDSRLSPDELVAKLNAQSLV